MSPVSISSPSFQLPQFQAARPPQFGMALATNQEVASLNLGRLYRDCMGDIDTFERRYSAEIFPMRGNPDATKAFVAELERTVAEQRIQDHELVFAEAVLTLLGSRSIPIAGELRRVFVDAVRDATGSEQGAGGEINGLLRRIHGIQRRNSADNEAILDYERGLAVFLDWLLVQPFTRAEEHQLRNAVFNELSPEHLVATQILETFEEAFLPGREGRSVLEQGLERIRGSARRNDDLENLVNGAAIAAIHLSHHPRAANYFPEVFSKLMEIIADKNSPRCRADLSAAVSQIDMDQQIGSRFNAFG